MLNTDFAMLYDLELDEDGMATCSVDLAVTGVTCNKNEPSYDLSVKYAAVSYDNKNSRKLAALLHLSPWDRTLPNG